MEPVDVLCGGFAFFKSLTASALSLALTLNSVSNNFGLVVLGNALPKYYVPEEGSEGI